MSTQYTERLNEFKNLYSKRDINKGYMQGLTINEYNRINSLHAYLISTNEGEKFIKELFN